jgi:WD40 repeat protein
MEAVYKCSFVKSGEKIVTSSEDQTIRMWSVPDGYLIYTYKAHLSPVSTVNFSPSGK